MSKHMLIDAAHLEEVRVAVVDGQDIHDFDFESSAKKQLRGNIYLAKVTRVEPSLQAAFVDYGGNRHGFLAFPEIHPDYYRIPVADRQALIAAERAAAMSEDGDEDDDDGEGSRARNRSAALQRYRIQEVIKRGQNLLVQVVKEERGGKGAALTTYLSLAGRYCVLMPNSGRGGGISRKITNQADRKRLKKVVSDLAVPDGIGLIVRTAGAKRTKTEIKRDYEYLLRLWEDIRTRTLSSFAPARIHEEGSLIKRALRDLFDKDLESIQIEGEAGYREAKDFVKMMMPSQARKIHQHKDSTPLLAAYGVEKQLETIFSPIVQLRSGGYLVINQTEALVAIDVNSGKSTKERSIEGTALRTNLEAASEAARQMRLRDLAGLVVIDFIDMEESKNDRLVEKRMKDALKLDRARVQMGKISPFGLLEISRQRRRTGLLEGITHSCPHCAGAGIVRSSSSTAIRALRLAEQAAAAQLGEVTIRANAETALFLLNDKRDALRAIEARGSTQVRVMIDETLPAGQCLVHAGGDGRGDEGMETDREEDRYRSAPTRAPYSPRAERDEEAPPPPRAAERAEGEDQNEGSRRRRRRGPRQDDNAPAEPRFNEPAEIEVDEEEMDAAPREAADGGAENEEDRRRRRRGRRGGRRRRDRNDAPETGNALGPAPEAQPASANRQADPISHDSGGKRGRRRRDRFKRPEADPNWWRRQAPAADMDGLISQNAADDGAFDGADQDEIAAAPTPVARIAAQTDAPRAEKSGGRRRRRGGGRDRLRAAADAVDARAADAALDAEREEREAMTSAVIEATPIALNDADLTPAPVEAAAPPAAKPDAEPPPAHDPAPEPRPQPMRLIREKVASDGVVQRTETDDDPEAPPAAPRKKGWWQKKLFGE